MSLSATLTTNRFSTVITFARSALDLEWVATELNDRPRNA
jgi:hypothetical protein